MKYGYFDDKAREYVITRPDTPLPWINYLGSQEYFGLISNTSGGYSFYKDARLRRLTRYRYNNAPLDLGGRYLYLRDNLSGESWSPSWMPVRRSLDEYRCRHGLGYTVIESNYRGINVQTRTFVPLNETLEIWQVTVTNQGQTPADLSLFSAIEFCLWDAQDDATNFQRNYSTGEVEIAPLAERSGSAVEAPTVIYHKTEYRERRDHFAYFACSEPLAGYDTQRDAFLGPYRGWDNPQVVETGQSGNSEAHGWQPIGSQHVKLTLQPGQEKQIIILLGYHENPKDDKFDPPGSQTINKKTVEPILAKFLNPAQVEAAFDELRQHWTNLLAKFQVSSPDEHVNRMVNIWNAYQCMVTFNLSRSASYFESGIGRGMGFRDSNQDLLGFVHMIPERARERILDLAATQLQNGGAFHQYQPLTKRGNNEVGTGFNDDPAWLVVGLAAYLKESGDWSILDAPVQYENEPGSETPLYEHLQRALQYTRERLGPHNLPLIGRADWNDCLNLNCFSDTPGQSFQTTIGKDGKVAESVFIAGLFVLACKEMEQIANYELGIRKSLIPNSQSANSQFETHPPEFYANAAAEMEKAVWAAGWDGEWFRRAYDDFGKPIGSRENAEGKIFIEPQGICILAGLGLENGNALKALDSVGKYLATPHGIVLQNPAYSRYYLEYGEISSYPPGYKENAGIFCHTNPWIMLAEAKAGRADKAFSYYKRICPSAREQISEIHRCEPYVYAQMIAGKDAPTHGEAKNSWLTGTAAWNYVAITQGILGIQPDFNGLKIEPALPSAWSGCEVVRCFRGVRYEISIKREGPGNNVRLTVAGQPVAGKIVPLPAAGVQVVKVNVTVA
ncbi:MAG: glycosyl transferase [Anaerolineales bacterium]|jgi:cellobiose phosphorylase|nr:glycosyl transferase [Anaerolineales bacterium]